MADTHNSRQPPESEGPRNDKGLLTAPVWRILLYIMAAMAGLWLLEALDTFGF